jgi:hypothetical protein
VFFNVSIPFLCKPLAGEDGNVGARSIHIAHVFSSRTVANIQRQNDRDKNLLPLETYSHVTALCACNQRREKGQHSDEKYAFGQAVGNLNTGLLG